MDSELKKALAFYKCHKEVQAAKIIDIQFKSRTAVLFFDKGLLYEVTIDFVRKHNPQIGGYFVLYEDGYESYSPAEAFEQGYIQIKK